MNTLHAWLESVWWQRHTPPLWLRLASIPYRLISRRHLLQRQRHASVPPLPLVSVGNITAGGSGKTPFVLWLAAGLKARGFAPVILCRGDGGRQYAPKRIETDDGPEVVGDEARLLFEAGIGPVIAGRDRVAAANLAAGLGDVLILDDGFQYRQLARRCDVLLIPASGVGNGWLIPAGPLREPLVACTRADFIVRTGEGEATPLTGGRQWRWQMLPAALEQVAGPAQVPPKRVLAACAIARPERFYASLAAAGIEVAARVAFADHHCFRSKEVNRLLAHGLPVVVTTKDAVKLKRIWPRDRPLWVLPLQPQAEEGLLDAIVAHILAGKSP